MYFIDLIRFVMPTSSDFVKFGSSFKRRIRDSVTFREHMGILKPLSNAIMFGQRFDGHGFRLKCSLPAYFLRITSGSLCSGFDGMEVLAAILTRQFTVLHFCRKDKY